MQQQLLINLNAVFRAPKSSEAQLAGALQAEAGVLDASLSRIKGHIAQLASAQAGKAGATRGPESAKAAGLNGHPGGSSNAEGVGSQAAATKDAAGAGQVEALKQELEHANSSVSRQAARPAMHCWHPVRMPLTGADRCWRLAALRLADGSQIPGLACSVPPRGPCPAGTAREAVTLLLLLGLTTSCDTQVAAWKAWHSNQKAECERLRQGRGDLEARMASHQADMAQTQVWHGACSLHHPGPLPHHDLPF